MYKKMVSAIKNNPQISITKAVYVLQAFSVLLGITFLFAVIINYVKQKEVAGTWLESHFKWQIRTFWYGLLWTFIGLLGIYIFIGLPILIINGLWVIYRVIKGWIRLNDGQEMYTKT